MLWIIFSIPVIIFLILYLWPLPDILINPPPSSMRFLDRNGVLLRDIPLLGEHQWRVPLKEVSPYLINAIILSEDKRFRSHLGVDPVAIGRAIFDALKYQRIVSGGSTITQQYVKNVMGIERTVWGKLKEAFLALALERHLSKDEILERYLAILPYSNNLRGVQTAARWYFGKDASHLGPAESAILAVIPKSPSSLNPTKRLDYAWDRARQILKRMNTEGIIDNPTLESALAFTPKIERPSPPFISPHLTTKIAQTHKAQEIRLTIDSRIQEIAQKALQRHLSTLEKRGVENGAVIVVENRKAEVLAMVGSRSFFDERSRGQVNAATSIRQPGSTLKPLFYAMAIDMGFSPATLLEDVPTIFDVGEGHWIPHDHDRRFRGPVRLREALASSLNIPAVSLLDRIGPQKFLYKLHSMGFDEIDRDASYYGVGLVLGNASVRLTSLVAGYSALARGGIWKPLKVILDKDEPMGHPVFSERASFIIADILSDINAGRMTFGDEGVVRLPFKVAVKTGTSPNHRDSWCIGFTPDYTVGVWVGNMSGKPMDEVWGAQGAAPVFREIMESLYKNKKPEWFSRPEGIVTKEICPISGKLRGPYCPGGIHEYFMVEDQDLPTCNIHVEISIDRRNGLLAGQTCPDKFVEKKPMAVLDGIFAVYAEDAGLDIAPQDYSPLCPSPNENTIIKDVRIVRPKNNETFTIKPDVPEYARTIPLLAVGRVPSGYITWLIDDKEGPTCKINQVCRWQLMPGRHKIKIKGVEGNGVTIVGDF